MGKRPDRLGQSTATRIAIATLLVAALLVLVSSVAAGNLYALVFAAWAMVPYGILYLVGRRIPNPWVVGGAGAAALAVEVGIRASVFVFPAGSTAAVALVFSPAVALAALPVGGLAGFLLGRLWRSGGVAVRSGIVLVSGLALGLTVLGLARPELFPTEVLKRRATLSQIGEPRIVTGRDVFETVLVSESSAWHVTGELDGAPGEEIAVVTHRSFELFDPLHLESHGVVDFDWQESSRLNWFSKLARVDGRGVIVQAGGGYSKTELLDLQGGRLWSYRPDSSPPPTALRPADLDGDGETELYASYSQATVRLDGAGRELWSRPTQRASLAILAPRADKASAWVVGVEYGRLIRVWNEIGDSLAEIPMPPELLLGVVDWPAERVLLLAGEALRGIGLDGVTRFEIPLAELTVAGLTPSRAVSVRFPPDGQPHLVLSAAAPSHVDRWRLLIISPEREAVYDEVFDRRFQLLTARAADGHETLLLSGEGLRALRPRPKE